MASINIIIVSIVSVSSVSFSLVGNSIVSFSLALVASTVSGTRHQVSRQYHAANWAQLHFTQQQKMNANTQSLAKTF